MNNNYLTFKAVDFSTDPFFLEWQWFKSEEATLFWETFLTEHPEKEDEILLAAKIIVELMQENDNALFSKQEKEIAVAELTKRVQKHRRHKKILLLGMTSAAILTVFLFLPFKQIDTKNVLETKEKGFIQLSDNEVRLITSSGEQSSFKEDVKVNYDSNGNIVVQDKSGKLIEEKHNTAFVEMNKLIVPKGKRSSLELADGSLIWVNSGTTVEFPSAFDDPSERRIKINGEIFIEVAKNPNQPFVISTSGFNIKVYGTKFNVSAYPDDKLQQVTVTEGLVSVTLTNANQENYLSVSQQLSLENGNTTIKNVDANNYTSWKDGILRFDSEPLRNILVRLSRYYDIDLKYNSEIANIHCSGKLYLFDDWKTVFDNVSAVSSVNYTIGNNEIIFTNNSKTQGKEQPM